jgi:hypothetical protein
MNKSKAQGSRPTAQGLWSPFLSQNPSAKTLHLVLRASA